MSIQVKNAKSITLGGQQVKQIKDTNGNVLWRKEPLPWWSDKTYLNSLTVDNVGTEINEVEINGQIHRVRLIGIDHDDLADGTGKAHTTWEFVELISDENGYSLASLWKDTNNTSDANFDYLNSTIRKNLVGEGNGQIMWYEKGSATRSSRNKSVLEMLPEGLRNALKIVKKKVNLKTTGSWVETEYTDKLFLLAPKEMGRDSPYAEDLPTYKYYEGHTEQIDAIRIKKQVKGTEGALTSSTSITDNAYGSGTSFAGYNNDEDTNNGSPYWLRSPFTDQYSSSWDVLSEGHLTINGSYNSARCVAPAFCL